MSMEKVFNFLPFTLIQFSKSVRQVQYKPLQQRRSQEKAPARTKLHSWYWAAKVDWKTLQSCSGSAGWAVTSDFTSQTCYYPFTWIICPRWVAKRRPEPQRVLWGAGRTLEERMACARMPDCRAGPTRGSSWASCGAVASSRRYQQTVARAARSCSCLLCGQAEQGKRQSNILQDWLFPGWQQMVLVYFTTQIQKATCVKGCYIGLFPFGSGTSEGNKCFCPSY